MEIFVDNYGSASNFTVPMQNAIKDAKNGDTFVFSAKEYHFYKEDCLSRVIHMTNTDSFRFPEKRFGMLFEKLENIELKGNGAVFVIHGDICSMAFLDCVNVKMGGFTVKYACPNNIEMRVKSMTGHKVVYEFPKSTQWETDGKCFTFFEQSPFTKEYYWRFNNDENSDCGVCHNGDVVYRTSHKEGAFHLVKSIKKLSDTSAEVTYFVRRKFNVGDNLTISPNHNRNTCGLFVNNCKNVSAENITVNYLSGFGWLSQICENVSFENIIFRADSEHIVSSFADSIHICSCKGDVKINNCYFEHTHDDPINVHSSFLRFKEKKNDNTAVFEFVHRQQGGYRAFNTDDKVKFYYRNNLAELDGVYTVANAVDDIENKTVTVEFNEKLPTDIDSMYKNQYNIVAENATCNPNVEISNCRFNAIPTRGILVTVGGKVRIHDNEFTNVAMANIFVSNDANDWYESGPVRDMEIYDNNFIVTPNNLPSCIDCSAILVEPITLGGKITTPIHKNISVCSNCFDVTRDRVITAHGVENFNVGENTYKHISEIKID